MTYEPPPLPPELADEVCDLPTQRLVTRRRFLTGLGVSVGTVMAAGYAINVFNQGPDAMTAPTLVDLPRPTTTLGTAMAARTLVVLELGGGNDALNMVVPHADAAYYDARRTLAIEDPLDLDGSIGLHPNLTNLASLYAAGDAAIVEGVGYPNSDLSHFVSMNTWWTGEDNFAEPTGWLGRYLDATVGYANPLAGISIGPGPSRAMVGSNSFAVAVQNQTGLQPNLPDWVDSADELVSAWAGLVPATWESDLVGDIYRVIEGTVAARNNVNDRLDGTGSGRGESMVAQLTVAANLITQGVAPSVIYVHGRGDFDTHDNQANRHAGLMAELDEAIAAFFGLVAGHDVALLTASEFGRRVKENGRGTDHGAAGAQLLIGRTVTGGRYGQAPSVAVPDGNGNLAPTVDFRSVYASILEEYLGVDATEVLGGNYETLGVFATT